jgi:hypothetical protein
LSKALRRPKNKLMNEAVHLFVQQRSRELEQEMEATLQALRAYRKKDPDFEKAIDDFVDAEASQGGRDPSEGRIIAPPGAVQSEIRRLLHA